MILYVSLVDRHKPYGQRFVGAYMVEIPYAPVHHGQIDCQAVCADPEGGAERLRPFFDRLLSKEEAELV
jgi:hypothetical protein